MNAINLTEKTQSGLSFADFDTVIDGKKVSLFRLTNRNVPKYASPTTAASSFPCWCPTAPAR